MSWTQTSAIWAFCVGQSVSGRDVVALHLLIRSLKTRFGMDLVPRCEPPALWLLRGHGAVIAGSSLEVLSPVRIILLTPYCI